MVPAREVPDRPEGRSPQGVPSRRRRRRRLSQSSRRLHPRPFEPRRQATQAFDRLNPRYARMSRGVHR
ncbi:MAG: hypothetical protein E6I68_06780 [Chloroflexi bacterium]|nr:MAG: hypothetical protein E6I68_06780 [Chloroflexota bacterium]